MSESRHSRCRHGLALLLVLMTIAACAGDDPEPGDSGPRDGGAADGAHHEGGPAGEGPQDARAPDVEPPDSRSPDGISYSCPSFAAGAAVGEVEQPAVQEASGLVASRTHAQVLWVHNDSGDSARAPRTGARFCSAHTTRPPSGRGRRAPSCGRRSRPSAARCPWSRSRRARPSALPPTARASSR